MPGTGRAYAEGTLRPDASAPSRRRELIKLGFSITRAGHGKLLDEVDQALGRHSTRLSKTWFHGWALQASMLDERQCAGREPWRGTKCQLPGYRVIMFDGFMSEKVITPIRTNAFKKPRFSVDVLDDLLKRVEARVTLQPCHALRDDMIGLSHVSFALRSPAGQIIRFLEAGELPGSYIDRTATGLARLRISHKELLAAIRRQERADIKLEEVRKRLALSSREIRQVVSAGLLRVDRRGSNGLRNAAEFVAYDDYEAFLERFQTPKNSAHHLGISPREVMTRIRAAKLGSAISNGVVRVYVREAVLAL